MFYCGRNFSPILLKLIFTVTNDLSYDQRMQRICGSLAGAGHEVLLVGRILDGSIPFHPKGYTSHRLQCFFNTGKLFYTEMNIRLFLFLLFRKFDAVCSIDLDTILPGYLATRIRQKPLVYDAHEYFTEVPEVIHRNAVKWFWLKVEAWIIPRVEYAYTVNQSLARMFTEKYRKHFDVIYSVPILKDHPQEDHFYDRILIYQGALNTARGLEAIIDAMSGVDATLWIIGEGDLSAELRERAARSTAAHRILFKGKIPPDELPAITRKATLGINVSENAGLSYYYSLNNKCFDYMHGGIPALTNDFPEYRIINESFEIMHLTTCDAEILKNDINNMLNNREYYLKLKQNCLLASENYCWQKEEVKLIRFYAQIR